MADLTSGFSVEASNQQIPPPVKTKVATCVDHEICLRVSNFFFNKVKTTMNKFGVIFQHPHCLAAAIKLLKNVSLQLFSKFWHSLISGIKYE